MIEISTKSLFFIFMMLIGPLLLRSGHKYRKYIFLSMNLLVYMLTLTAVSQFVIASLFIAVPYFFSKLLGKADAKSKPYSKGILIVIMIVIFSYLMKYDVIFETMHIPYAFAFKILGLSYFLFREIDFIMQYEYLNEEGIRITLIDYLNYILSFYTVLAGPILRYEEYVTDFYKDIEPLDKETVFKTINRIVNGYIKVYVISGVLSTYAAVWYESLGNHSNILTACGAFFVFAYLNGWYIYANFSGYCDIVVGFAKLAGLTVHENFNRPYLARSVVEFWNRHHITLSEWIRDYLFSPMFKKLISGSCKNNIKLGQYIALFLTFTIAGIWHGTDLNYLIYGLFQGLGIVVATVWKDKRKKILGKERNKKYENSRLAILAGRCVTWTYICLTFSFVGYDVAGLLFH